MGASIYEEAERFVNEERGVKNIKEALQGAMDIIAEMISDEAEYRAYIRQATFEEGKIVSTAKDAKTQSVYEMYYDFEEAVSKVAVFLSPVPK